MDETNKCPNSRCRRQGINSVFILVCSGWKRPPWLQLQHQVRYKVSGPRSQVPGPSPQVPSPRPQVPGLRSRVSGPRPQVPGLRSQVSGPRSRLTSFFFRPQTVIFLKILASKRVFLYFATKCAVFSFRDTTF